MENIYGALCAAFGGASQVRDEIVAEAICCCFSNNNAQPEQVGEIASALLQARDEITQRWEDTDPNPARIIAKFIQGVKASTLEGKLKDEVIKLLQ